MVKLGRMHGEEEEDELEKRVLEREMD